MSFKRGLIWTAAGQAAFFVIQLVGSVVVARLLSPYEMGVYALAVAITGLLNLIQSVGLGSYMVREPNLTAERISTAFTINAIISLLLSSLTALLALAGSLVSNEAGVRGVLMILSLTPLIGIITVVPYALLEREANFRLISIAGVARTVLATGGTITLARAGWGYYSIAYSQVAASFVQAIIICFFAKRHVHLRLSIKEWRDVGKFGSQMIAITGVNTLAARSSDLFLGKLAGLTALGLYNRASNVNNLFWDNIHMVMGRVAFAELARQKRAGMSLRPFYLKTVEMTTASLWPLFAGLAVLSSPLIRLVYGPKWTGASIPFSILAISAIVLISITLTWEVFVACGETAKQARVESVRAVIGTIFFIVGCTISLEAAAAARLADAVFSMLIYRPHLERMTETKLRDTGPIYLRSGMLTALAVLPAIALRFSRSSITLDIPEISAAVLSGVIIWAIALTLLRHPLYTEASVILRRWRRSKTNEELAS